MRKICKCPSCSKQYIVQGSDKRERFRCLCGWTVEVPQSRKLEAAEVVRCSSCGGSKGQDDLDCQFCGASFTLHEKDLHTMCPQCFCRISDKASYCHHCGEWIHPVDEKTEATSLPCPACNDEKQKLQHRSLSQQSFGITECTRCAGFWLSHEIFQKLQKESRRNHQISHQLAGATRPQVQNESRTIYRKCPECLQIMNRRQAFPGAGIVIDICGHHGIWFDDEELQKVLSKAATAELSQIKKRQPPGFVGGKQVSSIHRDDLSSKGSEIHETILRVLRSLI